MTFLERLLRQLNIQNWFYQNGKEEENNLSCLHSTYRYILFIENKQALKWLTLFCRRSEEKSSIEIQSWISALLRCRKWDEIRVTFIGSTLASKIHNSTHSYAVLVWLSSQKKVVKNFKVSIKWSLKCWERIIS